jgi:hypothetical protein
MWVFLSDCAVSIVAYRGDVSQLLVRARVAGDVERFARWGGLRSLKEEVTPNADYGFRAVLPRKLVASALAEWAKALVYTNFKDSVEDDARHRWYMDVWQAGYRVQNPRPVYPDWFDDAAGSDYSDRRVRRFDDDQGDLPWV